MTPDPPAAPAPRHHPRRDRARALLLAVVLTAFNAARPVTVDDPAYLRQAAWWAAHPFDPLGGEAFQYQRLVPAATTASAPVAIAWLALGHAVAGTHEVVLKLWLFPFAWLLAWALLELLRGAAPALARPLLAMTLLSPWLLPSFGFMLDVPMLALAVAALAVFGRDGRDRGWRAAVGAGVLAGLALQTKYSALPILVGLAAWSLAERRWRSGAVAVATALVVFVGIEALMRGVAGASPLLAYIAGRAARDPEGHVPLVTARRLLGLAGSAAPVLIPIGLTALGAPRRVVHAALAAVVLGFALLAFAPARLAAFLDGVSGGRILNLDNLSLGWMGLALLVVAAPVAWRAWFAPGGPPVGRAGVAWLAAECALAPFVSASGSVRRVLGALAAFTLVLARVLADRLALDPRRRADVILAAAAGVALGVAFWAVDVDSARAEQRALAGALERVLARGGGTVAVVGDHWGAFQHAAAGAGLRRLAVGRSRLERGDWLLMPLGIGGRSAALDRSRLALVDSAPLPHRLPLTTRGGFYDGHQALRRVDPGWIGVRLWRVTADGEVLLAAGRERPPR